MASSKRASFLPWFPLKLVTELEFGTVGEVHKSEVSRWRTQVGNQRWRVGQEGAAGDR